MNLRHIHVIDEDDESFSRRRTEHVFCPFFDVGLKMALDVHRSRSGRKVHVELELRKDVEWMSEKCVLKK